MIWGEDTEFNFVVGVKIYENISGCSWKQLKFCANEVGSLKKIQSGRNWIVWVEIFCGFFRCSR